MIEGGQPETSLVGQVLDGTYRITQLLGEGGGLPETDFSFNHKGDIVLGVGPNNENNAWGTFYEGAIVAGYPTDETEAEVMANIKAAGYSQ